MYWVSLMPIEQDYCTGLRHFICSSLTHLPTKNNVPLPPGTIFIGNIILSKKNYSTIEIASIGMGSDELYVLTGDIKAGQFISAS